MVVLDAHCDAPSQMYRLRDYSIDNSFAQVDFPKMKRGKIDSSFFAAYIPAALSGQEATSYAFELLDEVDRQVLANQETVSYARCASGVSRNKSAQHISILLGVENASAVQNSFDLLRAFYKRGVRYITLTHSADNQVGDSCTGKGSWGGLSPFGKDLVREMNRIGMMIDVAHSSDNTIKDVLSITSKPIAYTHGCCRALASHRRNISDELLKGISENGGVACMSIYPCFLDDGFCKILDDSQLEKKMWIEEEFIKDPSNPEKLSAWQDVQRELSALPRPSVSRVVDHIEHAVSVAGIDHVGIGTDYDGIEVTADGLENIASFPLIWDEMKRRGFSSKEIEKVAGANMLRVLKMVRKRP